MEIHNYQEMPKGQPTIATFSVYIPALQMTIHKFRLIKTKSGKLIIGYPSFCIKQAEPQGRALFSPYFEFSKERGQDFDKKALELLNPFLSSPVAI